MTREQLIKHWDVIKAFKDGKKLQVRYGDSFIDDPSPSFGFYEEYLVEDNEIPAKRLPAIEEVEKWFLENRVFVRKNGALLRIMKVDIDELPIFIDSDYISIERFCSDYTHLDGSELYITENEKPKLTYGGEIADFPIEIVERMLECQVEQGNDKNVSVFERNKIAGSNSNGFCWFETKEGQSFWSEVICGRNFDLFFKKYPKKQ